MLVMCQGRLGDPPARGDAGQGRRQDRDRWVHCDALYTGWIIGRTISLCIEVAWSVHASVGDYNDNAAYDFDDDVDVVGDGERRGKP